MLGPLLHYLLQMRTPESAAFLPARRHTAGADRQGRQLQGMRESTQTPPFRQAAGPRDPPGTPEPRNSARLLKPPSRRSEASPPARVIFTERLFWREKSQVL